MLRLVLLEAEDVGIERAEQLMLTPGFFTSFIALLCFFILSQLMKGAILDQLLSLSLVTLDLYSLLRAI